MKMNMNVKTVVTFALVVMSSAGLAMAGRGGGGGGGHAGGGGGGYHGGGGGYHGGGAGGGYHAPSFSTPHQNYSAARSRLQCAASVRQYGVSVVGVAECRGQPPGLCGGKPARRRRAAWNREYSQLGQPPERRQSSGHRESCEPRARGYVANRPDIGMNNNFNRANNFVRPTHADWNRGDWYHGDWHGNWNNGWNQWPVGWWGAGNWAGAALSAIPWSWGYWPYYNPYYGGSYVNGSAYDYSQPIVVAQAAAAPPARQPGRPPRSRRRPCSMRRGCLHAGRL